MLHNTPRIAKFRSDTAENELSEVDLTVLIHFGDIDELVLNEVIANIGERDATRQRQEAAFRRQEDESRNQAEAQRQARLDAERQREEKRARDAKTRQADGERQRREEQS